MSGLTIRDVVLNTLSAAIGTMVPFFIAAVFTFGNLDGWVTLTDSHRDGRTVSTIEINNHSDESLTDIAFLINGSDVTTLSHNGTGVYTVVPLTASQHEIQIRAVLPRSRFLLNVTYEPDDLTSVVLVSHIPSEYEVRTSNQSVPPLDFWFYTSSFLAIWLVQALLLNLFQYHWNKKFDDARQKVEEFQDKLAENTESFEKRLVASEDRVNEIRAASTRVRIAVGTALARANREADFWRDVVKRVITADADRATAYKLISAVRHRLGDVPKSDRNFDIAEVVDLMLDEAKRKSTEAIARREGDTER